MARLGLGASATNLCSFSQELQLESLGCTFCHRCRKNVPGVASGLSPLDAKATQTEQSSSALGGKPAPGLLGVQGTTGPGEGGEYRCGLMPVFIPAWPLVLAPRSAGWPWGVTAQVGRSALEQERLCLLSIFSGYTHAS